MGLQPWNCYIGKGGNRSTEKYAYTRARDFYDIYILCSTQPYDILLLREAFAATTHHRGTTIQVSDIPNLLKQIEDSVDLKQQWEKYRREFDYASDISYEQVVDTLKTVSMKLFD